MADMVKRFNTPDCESGMHEFEPRYPPQYEINSLAVRPNFFCLKVILRFLLTFSGGVAEIMRYLSIAKFECDFESIFIKLNALNQCRENSLGILRVI